jgi:hypothetical protein
MYKILAFLVFFATLFVGYGNQITGFAQSDIYISEVNYAGSVVSNDCRAVGVTAKKCSNDKWFEVSNPT